MSFQPSNVELRGPSSEAPEGKEKNWIQTIPGKPWFVFFRLYGPTEAFFERSLSLGLGDAFVGKSDQMERVIAFIEQYLDDS